jgi:hypothetical protein
MPILHLHVTADYTLPYEEVSGEIIALKSVLSYRKTYNQKEQDL